MPWKQSIMLQFRSLCVVCRWLCLHGLADNSGGCEGPAEQRPRQCQSSPISRKQVCEHLWFKIFIFKSTFLSYSCIGTNKDMSYFCVQCGWYWGPFECGPCGRAAGGTGSHRDTSTRPVRFWLVPGQQAVPLHGLCGRCQLCPHWDYQERHQVREPENIYGLVVFQ